MWFHHSSKRAYKIVVGIYFPFCSTNYMRSLVSLSNLSWPSRNPFSRTPSLLPGHYATPPPSPLPQTLQPPGMGISPDGRCMPRSDSACMNSSRSQTPPALDFTYPSRNPKDTSASTVLPVGAAKLYSSRNLVASSTHPTTSSPVALCLGASAIRGPPCASARNQSGRPPAPWSVRRLSAGWCPRRNDKQICR